VSFPLYKLYVVEGSKHKIKKNFLNYVLFFKANCLFKSGIESLAASVSFPHYKLYVVEGSKHKI
jgi:hypothetical protein